MWPISDRALASLARSGRESARVDVLRDGQLVKRIGGDGAPLPTVWSPYAEAFVPALGGQVNVARQQIRRDGHVEFLDLDGVLTPDDVDDLFAPMISELRPWVGIHFWDATPAEQAAGADVEWVPLGTLVITDVEGEYPAKKVSGYDRLWHLTPFVGNWPIAAGTPLHVALINLLSDQIPAGKLRLRIPETEFTAGALLYTEQTESIDKAHELALAMGLALYADPMGEIVARPEPSLDDPPAMTYEPGPTSMLLRPKRGVSAREAINVVVFTGEDSAGIPVRGVAEDTDPRSLTYVGRVGRRPAFESSPLIRTFAQAQLAARTSLTRQVGQADTYGVPVIQNPALEAGDVLRVRDPGQLIDLPLVADGFPCNLGPAVQDIAMRSRVLR